MKLQFGLREEAVYGHAYSIYIDLKGVPVKIGSVTLIDKIPVPPDTEENIAKDMQKHKIVFSMHKRYFRKLEFKQFQEMQNKILTGDKTKSDE